MTDEPEKPETPGMAEVSAKFVDEAEAATAAPPPSAGMPDDPLIELGRQWEVAYDNWLEFDTTGASNEEVKALEERKSDLGKIAWRIEDQAADIPAQSIAGVLAQLRMAGEHYDLTERDGTKKQEWANTYAKLTWQAWDGLERLAGTATVQEPEIDALFNEWQTQEDRLSEITIETKAAVRRIPSDVRRKHKTHQGGPASDPDYHEHYVACGADALDSEGDEVCDRISDLQIRIIKTPVRTLGGLLTKARVAWHITALDGELDKLRPKLSDLPNLDDAIFVWYVLQDAERLAGDLEHMARATTVTETPPTEDAALFDALAEYDRLVAIEQNLKHRTKVFRPGVPEADEADKAYKAACDEAMEAWKMVRNIPATTQAGLFARLQATDQYMTDLEEASIYEEDWSVIKADVQRIVGPARA